MKRMTGPAAVTLAMLCGAAVAGPLSVTLPASDAPLPPGPNLAQVNANCLTCHSSGMILTQPKLPEAAWQAEVTKMVKIYKAPVAADDMPAIVAYLVAIKGR